MSPRVLRVAAATAGAAVIVFVGAQGVARMWHMKAEVERLEREIGTLRAQTDELSAAAARLRSDPEAIEELARVELGLVKPGERVYKLPPSTGDR
jgi:cell division protein FtsB